MRPRVLYRVPDEHLRESEDNMTTKREALADVQPATSRKVANNTFEWTESDGTRHIRLHKTDVVTFKPNGDVILNTGGWRTLTTKARINEFAPVTVYSDRGTWYATNGNWHTAERTPFVDGMVLKHGKVKPPTKRQLATKAREDKLRAKINKFLAQIDKLDTLPEPDSGDCWVCLMFERGFAQGEYTPERGGRISKPGYKYNNASHLREHIRDNYLHGTLIQNAYLWAGASLFLWDMHRRDLDRWGRDSAKRYLRRYLKAQLGIN